MQNELILVVDDEPLLCDVTRRMLVSVGFDVLTATTASDGLRLMDQPGSQVRVVILDVGLPGIAGERALKLFKAQAPKVPVLMTSGFLAAELEDRFARAGAVGFLQKPYLTTELLAAVRVALACWNDEKVPWTR